MPREGRLAIPPAGSNFGLLAARTSLVPAASCAGVGAGIRSNDPSYTFELNDPFLLVARNANYWNADAVALRQIVFFPTESPDVEERDFRAGQLHVTYGLPVAKVAAYRRDAPDRLRIDPFLQTYFLRFNVNRAPFGDPRIRRALSLAIDRDAIARTVLASGYPPAPSLTPPDCGGYTATARVDLDVAMARRLLAEAGHPGGKGMPPIEVQVRNRSEEEHTS